MNDTETPAADIFINLIVSRTTAADRQIAESAPDNGPKSRSAQSAQARTPSATSASVEDSIFDSITIHLYRHTKETLEHLLIAVLVYAIVCLTVYKVLLHRRRQSVERHRQQQHQQPQPTRPSHHILNSSCDNNNIDDNDNAGGVFRFPTVRRVLLVIAHPDDECMFFGPTLLALSRRPGCQLYVLCLSNGDYERIGNRRRDELWRSCAKLRIPAGNITLVHATQLADDPHVVWHAEVVGRQVQRLADALDIDAVCTFDREGVSGHANHRAIFYAIASLKLAEQLPKRCRVLTLDTTNAVRKYSFVFDLLLTLALSRHWCVASWRDVQTVRQAMAEHRSQMVWFRRLYVLFSRYMVINSWRELSVSDVELEMQIEDDDET